MSTIEEHAVRGKFHAVGAQEAAHRAATHANGAAVSADVQSSKDLERRLRAALHEAQAALDDLALACNEIRAALRLIEAGALPQAGTLFDAVEVKP